jgi:hypothetical protein
VLLICLLPPLGALTARPSFAARPDLPRRLSLVLPLAHGIGHGAGCLRYKTRLSCQRLALGAPVARCLRLAAKLMSVRQVLDVATLASAAWSKSTAKHHDSQPSYGRTTGVTDQPRTSDFSSGTRRGRTRLLGTDPVTGHAPHGRSRGGSGSGSPGRSPPAGTSVVPIRSLMSSLRYPAPSPHIRTLDIDGRHRNARLLQQPDNQLPRAATLLARKVRQPVGQFR